FLRRRADLCVAVALRGVGTAGLSRAVSGVRLCAGAAAVDQGRLADSRTRRGAHLKRMAARLSVDRLSLECLWLRAVGAAGAGANRLSHRAVGPDISQRGDLCQSRVADR